MVQKKYSKGFSLIELMVSITIFVILLSIAAPTMSNWMAALRVKDSAESINMALNQARSEALRRNTSVQFSVNSDTSWLIFVPTTGEQVNKKIAQESGATTKVTTIPSNTSMVTLNGLGLVESNSDGSATITHIDVSSTTGQTFIKTSRIVIQGGGNFICDPSVIDTQSYLYCQGEN